MKFNLEVTLKNPANCDGCPCIDAELESCVLFDYTGLKYDNQVNLIRCEACIKKYGK